MHARPLCVPFSFAHFSILLHHDLLTVFHPLLLSPSNTLSVSRHHSLGYLHHISLPFRSLQGFRANSRSTRRFESQSLPTGRLDDRATDAAPTVRTARTTNEAVNFSSRLRKHLSLAHRTVIVGFRIWLAFCPQRQAVGQHAPRRSAPGRDSLRVFSLIEWIRGARSDVSALCQSTAIDKGNHLRGVCSTDTVDFISSASFVELQSA